MGKVGSKAILVQRTITFLHMFVFFHTFEGKKIEAAEALLLKQKFKEFTNAKKRPKLSTCLEWIGSGLLFLLDIYITFSTPSGMTKVSCERERD